MAHRMMRNIAEPRNLILQGREFLDLVVCREAAWLALVPFKDSLL